MSSARILVVIGCLILYGSLYPFNFSPAPADAFEQLLNHWQLITTRGDVLDNIALFVPWGVFGMLALSSRGSRWCALGWTLGLGLVLSATAQTLQIWLPTRNAAMSDVVWNMVGSLLGAAVGSFLAQRSHGPASRWQNASLPVALLVGFVLVQWLPLLPSLDLQLVKNQLKALLSGPAGSSANVFLLMAFAVLAGHLWGVVAGIRQSMFLLPAFLAGVAGGKLFLHSVSLDKFSLAGMALGCVAWWLLALLRPRQRDALALLALCALYTLSALAPLHLRDEPAPVSWLPFAAMLKGSMINNLRSLLSSLVLFTGVLFIFSQGARKVVAASVVLACWVGFVELTQTLLVGRTSDMTQPLLALMAGQLVAAWLQRPQAGSARAPAELPEVANAPPVGKLRITFLYGVAAGVIAAGLYTLLRIPGIPYNVRELFRGGSSLWALLAFAMALLWMGSGSVWLGKCVAAARMPAITLPAVALAASLVSLLLLWIGVTTESIKDISGSANVYWFVTNKDMWGPAWRDLFLRLNAPGLIGFVEHCIRYSALYLPLPLLLGLMVAVREPARARKASALHIGATLGVAALQLWLCKAIAFDWTSTDNLNELIARDGPWGWGGGGFLYALLALICLSGLVVCESVRARTIGALMICMVFVAVAIPVGWWLLNLGLEQRVEKYGRVFSGTQFLLGPDRSQTLSSLALMLRWTVVQAGATVILGAGLWLGHLAFAPRAQVRPALAGSGAP